MKDPGLATAPGSSPKAGRGRKSRGDASGTEQRRRVGGSSVQGNLWALAPHSRALWPSCRERRWRTPVIGRRLPPDVPGAAPLHSEHVMQQLRAIQHRRLIGGAVAILIAATLVALAVPVVVSAYFEGPAGAEAQRTAR
jgi:hypothetical protein